MLASSVSRAPAAPAPAPGTFHVIEVVDEQTGRGVPLVELETVDRVRYYTDSNGVVAFNEPGLMNQKVFFGVSSFGYEFPEDMFGFRGTAIETKPGGATKLKIKRLNIAQRLYRITGQGIYRDTILAGRKPPADVPLLNAQVIGQDSVQATVYRGTAYFFWGDTSKLGYPLGNFRTTGATVALPGQGGGLDPSVGVVPKYFTDPESGFTKQMIPLADKGPVWIDGLMTVTDDASGGGETGAGVSGAGVSGAGVSGAGVSGADVSGAGGGQERMLAHFSRMQDLGTRLERGLITFDDQSQTFKKLLPVPLDTRLAPAGHPFRATVDGHSYFYFPMPYPCVRVRADYKSVIDLSSYEAFTCLKQDAPLDLKSPKLDRDDAGKLRFAWKKNTPPIEPREFEELVKTGVIKRDELPFRLADAESGKDVLLHGGSVNWNDFRKRYVMIALELRGASMLGEIWYAESPKPEGPWVHARKIVTHRREIGHGLAKRTDTQDLYNPKHHPFFDQQGGKIIYFEGTYTNSFSGNPVQTPRYEYNQIMYRLDLSDPRLKLPDAAAASK
jgi:hypothetical protein